MGRLIKKVVKKSFNMGKDILGDIVEYGTNIITDTKSFLKDLIDFSDITINENHLRNDSYKRKYIFQNDNGEEYMETMKEIDAIAIFKDSDYNKLIEEKSLTIIATK